MAMAAKSHQSFLHAQAAGIAATAKYPAVADGNEESRECGNSGVKWSATNGRGQPAGGPGQVPDR
jgi:hypothetical protein